MCTAAYKVDVASDRRRRKDTANYRYDKEILQIIARHILFSSTGNFISCYSRK